MKITDTKREIKFRAWDMHKKKFVPSDVWAICNEPTGREQAKMIGDWEDYRTGEYFYPENQIIMQYTGLCDKNGKEIYEGDIVKNKYANNPVIYYAGIINEHDGDWDEWYCGFCIDDGDFTALGDDFEIIGNIYENPELLK